MIVCLFLALVCIHQGLQDRSCIVTDPEHPGEGTPDGRPCEMSNNCYEGDSEPGAEYRCEKAGMFGTYSIEDRVRYRGELHDPNELGMTVCIGAFAMLIGFANQRRKPLTMVVAGGGALIVLYCVQLTMSRGAILVFALVIGVYAVRRFGIAGMIAGGMAALPLMMLGGRSGEAADASTRLRYEAWSAGLQMFKSSPIFGVGQRQFSEHHYMTAHNSYVLALAELGYVGFVLFITLLYLTVKTLLRGVIDLEGVPGARPAQVWAMALLSSFAGMLFSINTLSFCYHTVLWVFLGLGGAWVSMVRHHKPDFEVKITSRDFVVICAGCAAFALVVLPIFLRFKGE
jgi:O-antigen ligase